MYQLPAQNQSMSPSMQPPSMQNPQMASSMQPSSSMPQQNLPQYAHGGRIKRGKMVVAHFNPHELHELDHYQGKTERCPRTGMRSYSHLEELLKNPHILNHIHQVAKHHAMGGQIGGMSLAHGGSPNYHNAHLNHMAHEGVHGDTELALIGPHTRNVFDHLAHGNTINPHTGHPQYWSLGGMLSGLGSALKGGASKIKTGLASLGQRAMPAIQSAAKGFMPTMAAAGQAAMPYLMPKLQETLGKHFGEGGEMLGGLIGAGAHGALGHMAGPGEHRIGKAIGDAVGTGAFNKMNGGSWNQALSQGMMRGGYGLGDTGVGNALSNVGSAMEKGQGLGKTIGAGMMGAATGINNPALKHGMHQMGHAMNQGQDAGRAGLLGAMYGLNQHMAGRQPQLSPNEMADLYDQL